MFSEIISIFLDINEPLNIAIKHSHLRCCQTFDTLKTSTIAIKQDSETFLTLKNLNHCHKNPSVQPSTSGKPDYLTFETRKTSTIAIKHQ